MKIDVRAPGMPPSQVHAMAATVRAAFRDVAERVVSVVVAVSTQAEKRHAARNCLIEVHMADGHVELVEERQRRVGSALRRAVQRAWSAAVRWLKRQLPVQDARDPQSSARLMAQLPVRPAAARRRGER